MPNNTDSNRNTTVSAAVNSSSHSTGFQMDSFDAKTTTWGRWVKRFETALLLFNADHAKKKQYLLHYMGASTYNIVCDRLLPQTPENTSYSSIVAELEDYFNPKANEILENYRFQLRKQGADEKCEDFLVALRCLATGCNFGDYLNTALRNQFVFGLKSHTIQNRLLEKQQLTLNEAITTAKAYEIAEKEGGELHQAKNMSETVNKIHFRRESQNKREVQKLEKKLQKRENLKIENKHCYRCGNTEHMADQCKFKEVICHYCKKKGHLRRMCLKEKRTINMIEQPTIETAVYEISKIDSNAERKKIKCNVMVNNKSIEFEIDTGAPVTLINLDFAKQYFPFEKVKKTDIQLYSYCQTKLECLGYIDVVVKTTEEHKAKMYIVRSDRNPLLGREWLHQMKLDWNKILRDQLENENDLNAIQIQPTEKVQTILRKYPNLFSESMGKISNHQARLYLKNDVKPKFLKARRVPFPLLEAVESEIQSQVDAGLLVKVNQSEWATPIVVVPKRDGKVRICGDYKVTVNPALMVDEHPLPTIEELFSSMSGGVKFTKIDLSRAYLQLEVHEDDRKILTLNTHKGLYQPTRMMFGLASAPAKWQRYMEQLLGDMSGVTVFLDDIKITACDDNTHLQRIDEVLRRLNNNNMRVNLQKSEFFKDQIEYCGYSIDTNGISKLKTKVDAIQNMKQPQSKDEVRAFLGMINYYGRFIPNLSDVVFPLNQLLHQNVQFNFDYSCKNAFEKVKQFMQSDTVLTHYNPKLPVVLAVDASPTGVGAVLSHIFDHGVEKPIQFASQTLNKVQQKYSQVDREAYAIIFGVKKFYQYIYGRKFILVTDNKAISQIFSPSKGLPTLSATRMQHYAIFLQSFDYEIRVKKSCDNANADAMSRLPTPAYDEGVEEVDLLEMQIIENLPITQCELAEHTKIDPEIQKLVECLKYGRNCESKDRFGVKQSEFTLQKGCVLRGIRVYIPKVLRERVLSELHTGHFGLCKMKMLARSYCWWPQMDRDIEILVSNCTACQDTRPDPTAVPVHCWKTPSKVFERVHMDYAGPLFGKYLLVLVDAFSKWPIVRIVNNMTTETTIHECRDIFSTFGIPNILVSDHGTQFNSIQFQTFLKQNGIVHKQGAPYHPATNGQAERFVQTVKNKLKASRCTVSTMHHELSNILLAYRRAIHPKTNKSPAMMMFGRPINSRLDLLLPQNCIGSAERPTIAKKFSVGERVAVRDYMSRMKWQYGRVIAIAGDLHYEVQLDQGRVWRRHVDQMRSVGILLPTVPTNRSEESNDRAEPEQRGNISNSNTEFVANEGVSAKDMETPQQAEEPPSNEVQVRRSNRIRKSPDRLQYD